MRPGELRGRTWRAAPARLLARLGRGEGAAVLQGGAQEGGSRPLGRAREGGRGGRAAGLGLEAEGRRTVEKREGKKKKEKREKKTKKRKKENRKKENKGRRIEKGFRKLGEFLEKLGEGVLRIFLGFSDTGVNSRTAVMARRTGRRDSRHARRREKN
jgi:hypothetical protein